MMASALWTVHGYGLVLEIGVGVASYVLALLILGYWRSDEYRAVKELLAG
jgi:hypothetical protein